MLIMHFASNGSLTSRSGDGYAMQYSNGVYYVFAYVDGLVPSSATASLVCTPNGSASPVTLLLSQATQTVNGEAVSGYGIYLPASVMQIAGPLSLNLFVTKTDQTVLVTYTTSVYVNAAGSATEWSTPITDAQWQEIVAYLVASTNYNLGQISSEGTLDGHKTPGLYYYNFGGDPYTLQIYVDGSGNTNQMKTDRLTGTTYNRTYSNSAWGAWALVANSSFTNYLPLTGGTLTGALGGTTATFTEVSTNNITMGTDQLTGTTVTLTPSSSFNVTTQFATFTVSGLFEVLGGMYFAGNADFPAGYTVSFAGTTNFSGSVLYGIRPSYNSSPAVFQSTLGTDFLGYVTAANVVAVLGTTPVNRATGDKNGNDITATYLPLAGGTMAGNLSMDGNTVYLYGYSGATSSASISGNAAGCYVSSTNGWTLTSGSAYGKLHNDGSNWVFDTSYNNGVKIPNGPKTLAALGDFSGFVSLASGGVAGTYSYAFPTSPVAPVAISGTFYATVPSGSATVSVMGLAAFSVTNGYAFRVQVAQVGFTFVSPNFVRTFWVTVERVSANSTAIVSSGLVSVAGTAYPSLVSLTAAGTGAIALGGSVIKA